MTATRSLPSFDVVVPSAGRSTLEALLASLAAAEAPMPGRLLLVEDRPPGRGALVPERALPPGLRGRIEVLPGRGAGPASGRNVGWRASGAGWVVFLDDDVLPDADWLLRLDEDLAGAGPGVAGVQGRIRVPLPGDRRPTDWERNVAGLEHARWATADMAYRREVLEAVGGFDERFRRAYREDADLGLRVAGAGWRIAAGRRAVTHPVRPAGPLVSLRLQAGNADDTLMRALHGPGWREAAGVRAGRRPRHLATTGAAALGIAGLLAGSRPAARLGAATWVAGTAELALARILPGPRTRSEVAAMLLTSVLMPPVASGQWLRGLVRARRLAEHRARPPAKRRRPAAAEPPARPDAVLLDRDGTLVVDVPYNGDPARIRAVPGAREALDRLRAAGVPLAVISNQSGVGRGLLTEERVELVNRRAEELLGPVGPWLFCPHRPDEGCGCRKPEAGLVRRAAEELGVAPERCAVIGDIGADVQAARAVGARGVLVPNPRTRREEVEAATEVAPDLGSAVDMLIGDRR